MKQPETHKFLKNLKNGRVFNYTEMLSKSDNMVPCDVNGNITEGHYAEADEEGRIERVRTAYLGNPVNGVLFPFTEILAQRDDLVSIETPEQWTEYMAARDGNAQIEVLPGGKTPAAPAADAPVLGRSEITGVTLDEVKDMQESLDEADVSHETSLQLPDIEGLNARDSKTALSDWAEKHFGRKLDRRPPLADVLNEATALLTQKAG